MITAETGLVGPSPAARLRLAWNELPSALKRFAKKYETSYGLPLAYHRAIQTV